MLSYTGQRNYFGKAVGNSDSTILALADLYINTHRREILGNKQWWFLEKPYTLTTTAATQGYTLRGDIERILSAPKVSVNSTIYTPQEAPSLEYWNRLNQISYQSDIPEWWFFYNNQLLLYPTPSAGGATVTLSAKPKIIDLSLVDFTTGSITTATQASTAIVGTGTSWTAGLAGMWLNITRIVTAGGGDGQWYEISTIDSTTTLTLARSYGGTSITAATAAYTIGQCSVLPDTYDSIPLHRALAQYFTSNEPDATKAQLYGGMAAELLRQMVAEQSNRSGGRVLDWGTAARRPTNPNLHIRG